MNRWFIVGCALVVATAGCATARAPKLPGSSKQKSNLTPGMVKRVVNEGQTRQVEVMSSFGAPNMVMTDEDGREVWTYDVISVASTSEQAERSGSAGVGAVGGGIIGTTPVAGAATVGGSAGRSSTSSMTSSTTFTLMITFDDTGTVREYRMLSTAY